MPPLFSSSISTDRAQRSLWLWISTLYFTQAVPYALVSFVSRVYFKRMEVSNTDIAIYVSLLGWPWVIKPLWSPLVDILRTRRWWIYLMQLLLSAALGGLALAAGQGNFLFWSLLILSIMAFASATHDIAADGFYMLALSDHEQAFFVGIRNTCYRLGLIACQGLLVVFAGYRERITGNVAGAWSTTFWLAAGCLSLFAVYHMLVLPRPARDRPSPEVGVQKIVREFGVTFATFFQRQHLVPILAFILLYRFAEAQLVSLKSLFFLDPLWKGGLGLSTEQFGLLDGTIGVVMLLAGGILGGAVASRDGLKKWLWWMVLGMNVPNVLYLGLALFQPAGLGWIGAAIAIEQFGYGFGFAGYMLYLLYVARGAHETAHYAICTGFMALGMMLPGMMSGWLQELIGYQNFFVWVLLATIPSFVVCWFIPLDENFGRKKDASSKDEVTS